MRCCHVGSRIVGVLFVLAILSAPAFAQSPAPQAPPPFVPVSGSLLDGRNQPLTGPFTLTFSIYAGESDTAPLWQETRQVTTDARGRYSIMLGAETAGGIPAAVFESGPGRWLGIRVEGFEEHERFLLTSVAYALKAGDANTLGGLPASAFMLAGTAPASSPARRVTSGGVAVHSTTASRTDPSSGAVANDVVTADDIIVQGSASIGLSSVNGEVFGFDTMRLKEDNARLTFMDASVAAGFPNRDWRLRANESSSGGRNAFFIDDLGTDFTDGAESPAALKTPFTILADAPTNAFVVAATGKIGLRTASPTLDIHAVTGDTPAFRFEQTSGSGFTAQTWDVAGNEANFFVRDVTGGSRLPFRIRPGAPTSSLDVAASGNVGIGTASPAAKLDVNGGLSVRGPTTSYDGGIRIEFNDLMLRDNYGLSSTGMRWLAFNSGTNVATFNSGLQVGNALSVTGAATLAGGVTVSSGGVQVEFNDVRFRNGYGLSSVGTRWLAYDSGTGLAAFNGGLTVSGNVGIGTATATQPLIMGSGAYVSAGGVWTNASSRSLKKGIADLSTGAAMQAFEQLKPVTFEYTASPGEAHVGFIAEDVPDLVATRDRKSLSSMDIVAVLTKVAQEQQRTIQDQHAALQALQQLMQQQQAAIAELRTRLSELEHQGKAGQGRQ